MKINLIGHHKDVTDAIREHVEEKFSKTAERYNSLTSITVIVSTEHKMEQVEISANYEGSQIAVHAEDKILYPAIAKAAKKFDNALSHRKGALNADKHQKPVVTTPEIAHEKVQGMQLT
ncbi:ribosome-associated translation inhibitor RaiA [Catenovulum sp. SM1970]|uniref:ribosome hibernation-promoting factor, HPF/YfiA family n=1 Tax=Marinifaba aquimaris TaxID=2741323 RepID=UPI0015717EC1|nr:ribosome-associated translation inhibitor RaiA [Marinifaba aquimaris]NTS75511.1 ribosome-associated translation inhibitor RaiA [Marinifaba aquimaris]